MCLLIFGMLKHVMGFFRMVQRRYRLVVDFSLTPMSSRKRKKRSQKAMVDITRRVRTRSEAPLPSGTERGARGVFGQGPNQCLINRSSGFVGHFSPLALLEAIMLCLFWLLGVQFSIQATHPPPPCIVQVTSNVNIGWSDAQYSQCAVLYLWDLWDIADRVAICCEMLLHSEDTDEPETAEALSKFAPQLWTSLVSHWFQKTSYMYTVLEWAAGLLERCDKQIFQPRREVWPSNPSGLAKVLLFLLRPFSSFFEYIWQFVILKKSDLDWGSNRDRLRALIGFNCTMSTWHVSSKSACASMDTHGYASLFCFDITPRSSITTGHHRFTARRREDRIGHNGEDGEGANEQITDAAISQSS